MVRVLVNAKPFRQKHGRLWETENEPSPMMITVCRKRLFTLQNAQQRLTQTVVTAVPAVTFTIADAGLFWASLHMIAVPLSLSSDTYLRP